MQSKLEILINARGEYQALDEAKKRVFALRAEVGALSTAIQAGAGLSIGAKLIEGLVAIPAAFKSAISAGVAYNANIEKQTASFKTLLGSASDAHARMRELAQFAAATPFELPQLVQASRTLQTFGGNALAAGDGLKLVGDAASAVNAPIAEASMWMGRLFASLRQGTPTGEAVQNLTQLGLISADTRQRLMALQGTALSEASAMDVMRASFGRYAGAMEEQAYTFEGLSSTLNDTLAMIRGEVSKPLFETLKKSLAEVIATLNSDGFTSGLKVAVRVLADLTEAGIKAAEILTRFSDAIMLVAAAWVACKIGQQVQGMIGYATSIGTAQAAELKLVTAVESEVAALTAKQAALAHLVDLQTRLNSLQLLGNTNAGTASAWAPGVRSAGASDVLAQTRSVQALNTALGVAPGLMNRMGTAARSMFSALGGWSTVAVAGMFAIDWWKNWKLESIDALDQVREAAASKLRGLRAEVAGITTELERTVMISRLKAQLEVAVNDPKQFTPEYVQGIQKTLEFLEKTPASTISANRRASEEKASADPVPKIDTLLQKHEDALQRRNRLQAEFNGLTADQVMAQRRASEAAMDDLKARQAALKAQLDPLEAQRAQLKAYTDQQAPALPKGEIVDIEQTRFGDPSKTVKALKSGNDDFAGVKTLSDQEVAGYEAALRFDAEKKAAQEAVNSSQGEYNRLRNEAAEIDKRMAEVEKTMPKAGRLDEYLQVSAEANKTLSEEAEKIAELRAARALMGVDDQQRIAVLRDEITLDQQKIQTLTEGLQKEQLLTDIKRKETEVQALLDKQGKADIETAMKIAQVKEGAAQRERDAIEKRRVDGKLSIADQALLEQVLGREKSAIDELIVAYTKLRDAKGTSAADKAAAEDTIAALTGEKAMIGKGSPPARTKYEQAKHNYADSSTPQNSYQGANEAIGAGMLDMATRAGTAWDNLHGAILNAGAAMQSSLSTGLRGMFTGTMSLGSAVQNIGLSIANSMLTSFTDTVAAMIMRRASMALFNRTMDAQEVASNAAKNAAIVAEDVAGEGVKTAATATGAAGRAGIRSGEAAHDVAMTGVQTGTHVAGEGAKTGSTLLGSIGRGIIRVGETIFHGIQVGIRVAAHLAAEVLMTGISIVQTAIRLPLIIAESLGYVIKAGVGALSALAGIPFVGPVLGIAAMAAVIAAGIGVVKSIGSRASGGPVTAGRPYLVGEYGPELMIPSESSVVMNHKETAAIAERLGAAPAGAPSSRSQGGSATILVDSRREADRFRRGANMETQILEVVQRNRYRIFST